MTSASPGPPPTVDQAERAAGSPRPVVATSAPCGQSANGSSRSAAPGQDTPCHAEHHEQRAVAARQSPASSDRGLSIPAFRPFSTRAGGSKRARGTRVSGSAAFGWDARLQPAVRVMRDPPHPFADDVRSSPRLRRGPGDPAALAGRSGPDHRGPDRAAFLLSLQIPARAQPAVGAGRCFRTSRCSPPAQTRRPSQLRVPNQHPVSSARSCCRLASRLSESRRAFDDAVAGHDQRPGPLPPDDDLAQRPCCAVHSRAGFRHTLQLRSGVPLALPPIRRTRHLGRAS